jgi:hypothetical protein
MSFASPFVAPAPTVQFELRRDPEAVRFAELMQRLIMLTAPSHGGHWLLF